MATRDLDRLAERVRAHRAGLLMSRNAAATAAGISKDTWLRVEKGLVVWDSKYVQVDRALGWADGSCIAIAEGGEPVLVDRPDGGPAPAAAPAAAPIRADTIRSAVFEAARATLPGTQIGDLDAFGDEIVEVLRRAGTEVEEV